MAKPSDSPHEFGNTYFVQDRTNQHKMKRLQIQDQMRIQV
jgi:hypothetical protein